MMDFQALGGGGEGRESKSERHSCKRLKLV